MLKRKKRLALLLVVALLAVFALAGCGEESAKLHIYNWGVYMDPEVLEDFTEETGIEVLYEEYPTNEDMYVRLKAGSGDYDLIFPSDYMIEKLIAEDMLLPLNWDNIPNAKNIDPSLMGLDYDPDNTYSVPYFWGTVGMIYNTDIVQEPVTSWDILWDEQYAKQIIMINSPRDSIGIALQRLGYSMNSHDVNELEAAKESLLEQKPLVLAYVVDEVRDMMLAGEGAIAVVWSGEGIWIDREAENLKYVVPEDGTNLWVDAAVIPKTAKNKEAAEKFIDFICRPDIAARISDYVGYSTPNIPAKDLLPQDIVNHPAAYVDAEYIEKCEIFRNPGDFLSEYDRVWTEVMSQ